jgi:hypothetical protein
MDGGARSPAGDCRRSWVPAPFPQEGAVFYIRAVPATAALADSTALTGCGAPPSVLDRTFGVHTMAFRDHPARRWSAVMLEHHKRRATTSGVAGVPPAFGIRGHLVSPESLEGRPPGRISRSLGASNTVADAIASPARTLSTEEAGKSDRMGTKSPIQNTSFRPPRLPIRSRPLGRS